MATKKKLLQAAAGSAGGAGALNVEDVFSTYLYDGNGESQSIDNGINLGQSNDGGSAHFEPDDSNDTDGIALGSANYITSGDFTIECFVWIEGLNSTNTNGYEIPTIFYFNSPRLSLTYDFVSPGGSADQAFNLFDTTYRFGSINQHPEATYTNTWVHVAVVRNSGTIRCYVDGTEAFNFSNTTDYSGATLTIGNNSNGTPVQGHISNFRVVDGTAVYTSNFTPPTSELTAISGTTLLTFTSENTLTDTSSSSHAFTVTGSVSASNFGPFDAADAGEGGLVWIKNREFTDWHALFDTERGAGIQLASNDTRANYTLSNALTSFNSNGFSLGNDTSAVNSSAEDYASWTFRKAPKFFDVVTYTGDGTTNRQISHNLGTTIGSIFIKATSTTSSWWVYHKGCSDYNASYCQSLFLNSTGKEGAYGVFAPHTSQTDTYFQLYNAANNNGVTYVAYLFAHNDGDGTFGPTGDQDIIKCGSCAGASVTVDLGFEPQLLITKAYDTSSNWHIQDNMRTFDRFLKPQASDAEVTDTTNLPKITSTGFEVPSTFLSGSNMIYIAIRRGPMAVPTDATDVFAIDQGINASVGDRVFNSGFPVDLMIRTDPTTSYNRLTIDRLRGNGAFVTTNLPDAETDTAYGGEFDDMEGVFTDTSFDFSNHYAYMWRRASGYMDAIAYTGNGTAGHTVSHNVGVAPEMMWVKQRNASNNWFVYHKDLGNQYKLNLNDTSSVAGPSSGYWNSTTPSDTDFTLGTFSNVNGSGNTYIAYLFASLDGISKCGSYTGNGTGQTIDCGFSSGARFVLIKDVDTNGEPWRLYDTARGLVAGDDAQLLLDASSAQITSGFDLIDPDSSGFALPSSIYTNNSGVTYIFYAIA